jgi:glyoxylase-like metal-dependent hydrolase (beta-lactamase superfamily II)
MFVVVFYAAVLGAALPAGLQVKSQGGGMAVNAVTIFKKVSVYRGDAPQLLLQTHARRDVVGVSSGLAKARQMVVPAAEEKFFTNPGPWWDLYWETRFHDYDARHSKWPIQATTTAANVRAVKGGDTVTADPALRFDVIDTPGYTAGSITYLITLAGKRIAFTGDLIYDGGRIVDLYSLQDSVPDAVTSTRVAGRNTVRGYHGFAARAADLMESLRKVQAQKPDLIVPARGPVIENPEQATTTLLGRLQQLMREHFSTDALRWYWGDDNLRTRAKRMIPRVEDLKWMEMAETRKLPDWVIPIQNSKLILSRSGGAFLVDCGYEKVYETVEKLRAEGRFRKLEGIYVTHYHDDHTDYVAEAAKRSGAPVFYSAAIRDVLENPGAYKLPAMTRNAILSGQPMAEGQKKQWHEFEMEFAFFPGQTLYHGVMLLSHSENGTRILFGGDSFTPSGMDDYCLLNRNLTGENEGYLYCLQYLRRIGEGVFLTNQHVDPMWTYSKSQIDQMEQSLRRRSLLLKDLFPFDSPNYGVDEQWARFYPYGIEAKPGAAIDLQLRITNHSPKRRTFVVTPQTVGSKPTSVIVEAGKEGTATIRIQVPKGVDGVQVVTADVTSENDIRLTAFAEALIRVK